ncbi:MAG: glycerophosphodiester phosphodiesterase [Acidimicrobiales bacterium]
MPARATDNPWLDRRVLAYAHRGGAREGPSSTLAAMGAALAAGATALELDVHATADGHLVCCHDPTVDRTTNGTGAIAELTLAEVKALDNAWWFVAGEEVATGRPHEDYIHRGRGPADPAYAVPTLHEVLTSFPGVLLNLDIKRTAPDVVPYEAALAGVLAEHGRTDDVMVASFSDAATAAFQALAPDIATSAGALAVAEWFRAVLAGSAPPPLPHQALQLPVELQGMTLVDQTTVAAAHRAGLAVHVWTIDDPAEMQRLVALGVDGIMSDRPSVLAGVLTDLGVAWKG